MMYIIIPVFNNLEFTKNCLNSLFLQTYRKFRVVLVDDGSMDGTESYVMKNFPDVKIIKGEGDWWWSKSMNAGLTSVVSEANDTDLILSLNNDLIVNVDYLHELINLYYKHNNCLIGSISLYDDTPEKIAFVGIRWSPWTASYKPVDEIKLKYSDLCENMEYVITDLLPGRGTLYSVKLIKEIGVYDCIHFPQYIADEEFSLRARKAGYQLIVSIKSPVYSVVNNTGINFNYIKPTIRRFVLSLVSIRSANNIKARFYFSLLHARIPVVYIALDLARIIVSFVKKYFKYYFLKL